MVANFPFERRVRFAPSHDLRAADPAKNYGIGAVRITFYLIGPKGAVQWMIGTNWYVASARQHIETLPQSTRDALETSFGDRSRLRPQAWDLGYHAHEPQFDGQEPTADCEALGGPCYYDGSSLNAERLIEPFLNEGDKAVWRELESYYHLTFPADAEATA